MFCQRSQNKLDFFCPYFYLENKSLKFRDQPSSESEQNKVEQMQHELKDDKHEKYSEDSCSRVLLIIKGFVNIMISIFILAPCSPVNYGKKHIDGAENMGVNEMQDTNRNITYDHFDQHENRCHNVFINNQTVDLYTWIRRWPVGNGDHKRVHTCYCKEHPQRLVEKRQLVVIIFGFGVWRPLAVFVALVFGGEPDDVCFRLESAWSVPCRVVFDSRTAAVVSGDEHSKHEVRGHKGQDPVAEV